MAQQFLTTNEVAARLDVDPKALRKFFRSDACKIVPVGQGKRYQITSGDVKDLIKAYEAWRKGKVVTVNKATATKTPTKAVAKTTTPKPRKAVTSKPAPVELDLELDDAELLSLEN